MRPARRAATGFAVPGGATSSSCAGQARRGQESRRPRRENERRGSTAQFLPSRRTPASCPESWSATRARSCTAKVAADRLRHARRRDRDRGGGDVPHHANVVEPKLASEQTAYDTWLVSAPTAGPGRADRVHRRRAVTRVRSGSSSSSAPLSVFVFMLLFRRQRRAGVVLQATMMGAVAIVVSSSMALSSRSSTTRSTRGSAAATHGHGACGHPDREAADLIGLRLAPPCDAVGASASLTQRPGLPVRRT